MKLLRLIAIITAWLYCSIAQAGVATDISNPAIKDLLFSYREIALVTDRATYVFDKGFLPKRIDASGRIEQPFSISPFARVHIGALGKEFYGAQTSQEAETFALHDRGPSASGAVHWKMTNYSGDNKPKFSTLSGYCGEGLEQYHKLFLNFRELNTFLPGCESISDMLLLNFDQLWLGSYEQHEYSNGPGSGVRVISLKPYKLLAAFSPATKSISGHVMALNFNSHTGKLSKVEKAAAGRAKGGKIIADSRGQLADGYVRFIRNDSGFDFVWVLTETALHQIKDLKVIARRYLSEQFNNEGQVTLFASSKPQSSNPWAILARHTKLVDTKYLWSQLQQNPKVAKRLTYEYDELGDHFRIDGKLFNESEGFVYNEFRLTPQQVFDLIKTK